MKIKFSNEAYMRSVLKAIEIKVIKENIQSTALTMVSASEYGSRTGTGVFEAFSKDHSSVGDDEKTLVN